MRIETFAEIDSTNAEAKRRALAGAFGPLWLRADTQTAGRGRRGRGWASAAGNLFATGLYTLEASPGAAAQLSFAAALAAAAVAERAAPEAEVRVKWPNDVLIAERKCAGVLLESGQARPGRLWLAVGVGINLASAPSQTDRPAAALGDYGDTLSPADALQTLIATFERWRAAWAADGFAPIRTAWLAKAYGLGAPCQVRLETESLSGVFADLGEEGALRLELADGSRRFITAGDVFFPNP